jgi:ABC-type thiamin/hydroxymethylpyrimidine transport system permease subunit
MRMVKGPCHFMQQTLKRAIFELLKLSAFQVAALSVTMAVIVSIVLVSFIDFLWNGGFRFNTELQFAGIVVPFIDGALIVGLLVALLDVLRDEVKQRTVAEKEIENLAFHEPLTGLPNRKAPGRPRKKT